MPKYLLMWEIDASKAPVNPKERGAAWTGMLDVIKQDMKDGKITDWGAFAGEGRGYSVSVMSELDLAKSLQRFFPYITFRVNQVMTVDQTAELAKSLSG
ncbi:MAG: hypothetical protein A2147_01050 [Chloroflexi bacterium RBG_16_57_8]|nr:MAG: hypothetical protein A2147_01050 [Chloroflexi bacterium RBG_16_57_8]